MRDEFKNALHKLRKEFKSDERLMWDKNYVKLSDTFDNLVFDRAGGACPVQAEGTYEGQPFYFRYRWGIASLGWGGDPISQPEYSLEISYGDGMQGFLTAGEFHHLFKKMLQSLIRMKAGKDGA